MDLDEGYGGRQEGIAQRPTRVGVGRRVHHGAVYPGAESVDRVDQLTFVVALDPFDGDAQLLSPPADGLLQRRQGRRAVDVGFPLPEKIEVGPVQDGDVHLPLETLEPRLELIEVFLVLPPLGPAAR